MPVDRYYVERRGETRRAYAVSFRDWRKPKERQQIEETENLRHPIRNNALETLYNILLIEIFVD